MEKFFINLTKEHYSICGMTATICCRRGGRRSSSYIQAKKKLLEKYFTKESRCQYNHMGNVTASRCYSKSVRVQLYECGASRKRQIWITTMCSLKQMVCSRIATQTYAQIYTFFSFMCAGQYNILVNGFYLRVFFTLLQRLLGSRC